MTAGTLDAIFTEIQKDRRSMFKHQCTPFVADGSSVSTKLVGLSSKIRVSSIILQKFLIF